MHHIVPEWSTTLSSPNGSTRSPCTGAPTPLCWHRALAALFQSHDWKAWMYLPSNSAVGACWQLQLFMVEQPHTGRVLPKPLQLSARRLCTVSASVPSTVYQGTKSRARHAASVTTASLSESCFQLGELQTRTASCKHDIQGYCVRQVLHEQTSKSSGMQPRP